MSKGNILVIDDEDLMCDLIKQVLEMKDFSVTTITNSTEGLEEIKAKRDFDVIIADVRMPNVSGIDLLRAANAQNMNYQFILITGFYNLLSSEIMKSLKPFGSIRKPFDIHTLSDIVEKALQKKRGINQND